MQGLMKAAILFEPGTIKILEREIPTPADDEALIRVKAVGLCGSDVHYYEHGKIGPYVVRKPIILGHESAGEIVELGKNVKNLSVGQRVTIEPGVTCGRCEHCKSGRYNLCPDVNFLATPPYDGAFCEYITIRSDFLFPIPDAMSFEEAALVEPFSVGLHAVRRGKLQAGETVVILGMGPIGLLAAAAAKTAGATKIIGVDLEEFRLEAALKLGATDVINLRKDDFGTRLSQLTEGKRADLAIETAGNPKALQSCLVGVRRGGRVVIVGLPPQEETGVNIPHIVDNEIDIYGVFRYSNTYKAGVEILSSGVVNLEDIITDRFTLDQVPEAFEKAIKEKSSTLKIVIHP
ncbi:NAD(P)-dependent alcohol dehydrogenase [Fodinisporobacter ferrooxydans]|uniref:NAD(P)-dependent alcohol dehydrogenase n=1 Tax=Fodinisporobacter ferrooxydans TaxID=2901836 RepID=A0ABY4CJA1_9BACL|nr:NAD(P)-dependent alcohol dehydrogenase [Alicyclobacillaceae bacterium MYW30-H2]